MGCEGENDCDDFAGDEGLCYYCGCVWDFGTCFGDPTPCEDWTNQFDCEDCFCTWIEAGYDNVQINIGDSWKDCSLIQINIGDSWKTVTRMYINIGDSWKTVFEL